MYMIFSSEMSATCSNEGEEKEERKSEAVRQIITVCRKGIAVFIHTGFLLPMLDYTPNTRYIYGHLG